MMKLGFFQVVGGDPPWSKKSCNLALGPSQFLASYIDPLPKQLDLREQSTTCQKKALTAVEPSF